MYTLSNCDIERISREITSILENARVSAQGCTKIRLTAEELLMKYQEKFGSETELALQHTKRFGKVTITLQIRCGSFDPMATLTDEDFWLQNILQSLGYVPTWSYKNNKSAESAINQIKEKKYDDLLEHYRGDLLFVGINYDPDTKEHQCRIED